MSELPNDVEVLHRIILAQLQTNTHLQKEIAHLQKEVDRLSRLVFRPKSERRRYGEGNPKQLFLFAADQVAEAEETAEAKGVEGTVEIKPTVPHGARARNRGA